MKYRLEPRKDKNDDIIATKEGQEFDAREQSEIVSLKMMLLSYQPKSKVWQIVPPEIEPTFVKGGPLLGVVLYKMAQRPLPKSGLGTESLKRLKALGFAALMFTQDFDQQFAFSPEYVREALTPYLEEPQSWFVPGTLEPYTFNTNLSGRYHFGLIGDDPDVEVGEVFPAPPQPFIKNTSKVVLFYEGHDQKPTFRYNGKASICFADGHTALVTPDEASKLIWNPA